MRTAKMTPTYSSLKSTNKDCAVHSLSQGQLQSNLTIQSWQLQWLTLMKNRSQPARMQTLLLIRKWLRTSARKMTTMTRRMTRSPKPRPAPKVCHKLKQQSKHLRRDKLIQRKRMKTMPVLK